MADYDTVRIYAAAHDSSHDGRFDSDRFLAFTKANATGGIPGSSQRMYYLFTTGIVA
jgi:hypothetical protein